MSQGELHARALSLFLPRATLPASTFRFLVIDDPVQSMDQARVDGLAKVLDHVARDRQVIVLTHDDRLPESVRRLIIEARVIGVPCRGVGEERRCSRCDRRARAMPHSGRGRVRRGGAPPPAGAGRGPRGCRADGRWADDDIHLRRDRPVTQLNMALDRLAQFVADRARWDGLHDAAVPFAGQSAEALHRTRRRPSSSWARPRLRSRTALVLSVAVHRRGCCCAHGRRIAIAGVEHVDSGAIGEHVGELVRVGDVVGRYGSAL